TLFLLGYVELTQPTLLRRLGIVCFVPNKCHQLGKLGTEQPVNLSIFLIGKAISLSLDTGLLIRRINIQEANC
ncbi:MAG: hypothetical protein V3V31_02205, partial [Methylococcales bacterium]